MDGTRSERPVTGWAWLPKGIPCFLSPSPTSFSRPLFLKVCPPPATPETVSHSRFKDPRRETKSGEDQNINTASSAYEGLPCSASSLSLLLPPLRSCLPLSGFLVRRASKSGYRGINQNIPGGVWGEDWHFSDPTVCQADNCHGWFCPSNKRACCRIELGLTLVLSLLGGATLGKELSFSQETCFLMEVSGGIWDSRANRAQNRRSIPREHNTVRHGVEET